ncbi:MULTISPECIES: IS630 family transposase [unclassified Streptomyces]|uniref:IS630 family transposase n=1 Tax=unclassified Streptomyces TaxID=2593676 RepID=UPI00324BB288
MLDAGQQQLGGSVVLAWDNLNTHISHTMRRLAIARPWLTNYQLSPYASEPNPVEGVWALLKRTLASLSKHTLDDPTTLVKIRLKRVQCRPRLIDSRVAKSPFDFHLPQPQPQS